MNQNPLFELLWVMFFGVFGVAALFGGVVWLARRLTRIDGRQDL